MEQTAQASFGQLLKRYRLAAGLSQEALAERAALSARAIAYLERDAHTPFPATILRLAQALALTPQDHALLLAATHPTAIRGRETPYPAARNPYKGLRAFTGADAGDFFGREDLVATLLAAMRATKESSPRFLAVVGPSGSGKSSVVQASLLPRLRRGALPGSAHWTYLDLLRPGVHPLEALAGVLGAGQHGAEPAALRAALLALCAGQRVGNRVILVVDQAEELFTLCPDEGERHTFIDLITVAATEPHGPFWVILTLRADFYDRPMSYPAFGKLMETCSRSVLPMDLAELRAAIERPAALPDVQVTFENGLVTTLLAAMHGQAGALPLLQFALDELFEHREGRCLTLAAYEELGGVRGALASQAETTFAALPSDAHRRLARALFLRLIDPGGAEHDAARRRAARDELALPDPAASAMMRAVVDAFVVARLLTGGETAGVPTIEVSHEALFAEWPRLAGWLREAREDVRLQGTISADVAEWLRRGHPSDRLYRGVPLDEALAWAQRNMPSATERAFLDAGLREREQQAAAEQNQQARELDLARQTALANRQAATRLRILAAALSVFLLAAVGLTALAIQGEDQARQEAQTAARAQRIALARQLAAQALNHLDDHYDLALLLAVEATRVDNTVETRSSLVRTLEYNPALRAFLHGHQSPVVAVAAASRNGLIASGDVDGTVRLWQAATGRPIGVSLRELSGGVTSLSFDPDGLTLAVGAGDGRILLWDAAHRTRRSPALHGYGAGVQSLCFGTAGTLLAAAYQDGQVRLWDMTRLHPVSASFLRSAGFVTALACSRTGALLATGAADGSVRLWDTARKRMLGRVASGHKDSVSSLAFSSDGTLLAMAGVDSTIGVWNLRQRRSPFPPLIGHAQSVTSVAFSPDGKTLASASADGTIRLWDMARGQPRGQPLTGPAQSVNGVAFSPDGTFLVSGGNDNTVILWDLTGGHPLSGHTAGVTAVAFSPDGRVLASGSSDKTVRLWDTGSGRPHGSPLGGHTAEVTSLAFSRRGILASGSVDRTVRLWDVAHHRALGPPLDGFAASVTSLAFSPNGRILAAGSSTGDGRIRLWSVPAGALLHVLPAPASGVGALAFSPNGRILAAGYADGQVRLWDATSGRPTAQPLANGLGGILSMAFSPDGAMLAAGGTDRIIHRWGRIHWSPLPPLIGHGERVSGLVFSPDGTILASASWDYTVRLWDVATGQSIGQPLVGLTAWPTSVAYSPTGAVLAVGSYDATVHLWDVGVAAWIRHACRVANRNLTAREWRAYLGAGPYQKTCPALP